MNEMALKQPRRILPRWRNFPTTARLGELKSTKPSNFRPPKFSDNTLLLDRWKEERIPGIAAEVLSHALLIKDRELAMEAAQFLEQSRDASKERSRLEMVSLAVTRSDGDPTGESWFDETYRPQARDIRSLRHSLRILPHNAIAWAELALLHAQQGRKKEAGRCMRVAVALAPEDRFILRSASRAFAHLQEHEIGLRFLNRSARTKEDPWLLAAQIALSQSLNRPQRYIRNAKQIIDSGQVSSANLSELNAALGSILHHEGADKKANKHFRACLQSPTENAVCQVICDQNSAEFQTLARSSHPQRNYESEARTFYDQISLESACDSAGRWLADEPFSARPALFGSFVAAVALEDYERSLAFLKEGLKPNPHSTMLLNNMALTLARMGSVVEASEYLRRAKENSDKEEYTEIVLTATQGLIQFRSGEVLAGRSSYEDAIARAKRAGRVSEHAMALVFLAREEIDAGTDRATAAASEAEAAVRKLSKANKDTRIAMARLKMAIGAKEGETESQTAISLSESLPALVVSFEQGRG